MLQWVIPGLILLLFSVSAQSAEVVKVNRTGNKIVLKYTEEEKPNIKQGAKLEFLFEGEEAPVLGRVRRVIEDQQQIVVIFPEKFSNLEPQTQVTITVPPKEEKETDGKDKKTKKPRVIRSTKIQKVDEWGERLLLLLSNDDQSRVAQGDTIIFQYGKENHTGTVESIKGPTATVKLETPDTKIRVGRLISFVKTTKPFQPFFQSMISESYLDDQSNLYSIFGGGTKTGSGTVVTETADEVTGEISESTLSRTNSQSTTLFGLTGVFPLGEETDGRYSHRLFTHMSVFGLNDFLETTEEINGTESLSEAEGNLNANSVRLGYVYSGQNWHFGLDLGYHMLNFRFESISFNFLIVHQGISTVYNWGSGHIGFEITNSEITSDQEENDSGDEEEEKKSFPYEVRLKLWQSSGVFTHFFMDINYDGTMENEDPASAKISSRMAFQYWLDLEQGISGELWWNPPGAYDYQKISFSPFGSDNNTAFAIGGGYMFKYDTLSASGQVIYKRAQGDLEFLEMDEYVEQGFSAYGTIRLLLGEARR